MANQRRAGIVALKIDGSLYDVKGAVTYGLGKETREAILGSDRVHGYKSMVTVPFVECEFTDSDELSLDALSDVVDSTVEVQLANGKVVALRNAWCTNPDGLGASSEEGNIKVRFEGLAAEEIGA
jgi:hypothetical protein